MRESIARRAVAAAHVLVVEVPGWGDTRMSLERELERRGWTMAVSPADADILLVCGAPGRDLGAVCDHVWSQLPGPRARSTVLAPDNIVEALDAAAHELLDERAQRHEAATRPAVVRNDAEPEVAMDHAGMDHAGMDMSGGSGMDHARMDMSGGSAADHAGMDMSGGKAMDHSAMDHSGMDHSAMDHSAMDHSGMDHAGMDHSGMDMPMPGGTPLATGGPDRDGLEMDVLNVPLGPVLPNWPAGLVVRCQLQGDVIVSARAEVLGSDDSPVDGVSARPADHVERGAVIGHADAAALLLATAGWGSAAQTARGIRNDLIGGSPLADAAARLNRLARRVERSAVFRWSLAGISIPAADPGSTRTPELELTDLRLRLLSWLRAAGRTAESEPQRASDGQHDDVLGRLAAALLGTDVAIARLIVAGSRIDTALIPAPTAHAHG